MAAHAAIDSRLLIHGVTCTCRPGCPPEGVCRWVGCCRSPIESARLLPSDRERVEPDHESADDGCTDPECCAACRGAGGDGTGPCSDCQTTGHAHPMPNLDFGTDLP